MPNVDLTTLLPSSELVRRLLVRWREDPQGTYRSWFLWEERLKNFGTIRRGISAVVAEIESGTFGNTYKGSSLQTVVKSIAEQRQIFRGADHAFIWKPKLRIPDIYESPENQRAFGRFLEVCAGCGGEEARVLEAVRALDRRAIKGLGPAAANILYFLHPTVVSPSNTAIVKGYNRLTGSRVKLGRWEDYLAMRAGVLALNALYRDLLSNDLGAVAGFLFDLGHERYPVPPRAEDPEAIARWETDLAQVRAEAGRSSRAIEEARKNDHTHTEIQGWLRDLGRALGFGVWIASNDVGRPLGEGRLGEGCLPKLPPAVTSTSFAETIRLIDVIWVDEAADEIVAAFEVEHTTSIYSGIIRMLDLALGLGKSQIFLCLVAPDAREKDVREQLRRPAFGRIADLDLRYVPYSALSEHREAMARFGKGLGPMKEIARRLS